MLVLYNAKVLLPDFTYGTITALAIDYGRIIACGNDSDILNEYSTGSQTEDLHGKIIWPGLVDAHIHLENYAQNLSSISCETNTRIECLKRVQERAQQAQPGQWILGHGWNQNDWVEGFGTATLLDSVAPDNPVFLTSKSLHSAWINTKALQLAEITSDTPDPDGGVIQRDGKGNPTGILFESAVACCEDTIPKTTPIQLEQALVLAQNKLLSMGITGVHDFDGSRCFAALQVLHQKGDLHLRVVKAIMADDMAHAISLGLRTGFGDDLLRIGPVKFFADGALGPQTAAMLRPYDNSEANSGLLQMTAGQILESGKLATQNGLSLAIHAIGDKANREVLDAFQELRSYEKSHQLPALRHRIEHVQLIDPADQGRFAEYQIIASMQPAHAPSDMLMADRYWGSRSAYAYAWRSMLDHHSLLVFGSDAPVESPNPFWGLHAAVSRRRFDGSPDGDGWHPEQRLTLQEALQAYTTGPAFSAGMENRSGKLAPGYFADLIVLDIDPFQASQEIIPTIGPESTMVNGNWVWKKK